LGAAAQHPGKGVIFPWTELNLVEKIAGKLSGNPEV